MNKRSTLLRLPCSALRILKRLQHKNLFSIMEFYRLFLGTLGTIGTIGTN
ncbi:MAG: hypothetical protein LBH59_10645 [Planctomycetaceae bacterium]|nr:hypothetical protein [Planctomycetaceae bacterium]